MAAIIVYELDVGEDKVVWACACLCTSLPEGAEATPLYNPNLTSLTQIQKTPQIYAEIFGPNLAAKHFYRSPLGVMHCMNVKELKVKIHLIQSFF
jgi:hypothetical protein